MKILWKGNCFNPTGIATANREIVKELVKQGCKVQVSDIWNSKYDFNKGLEHLNQAIDPDDETFTIFADYPQYWQQGYGKLIGHFLHEGTRLQPGWAERMNTVDKMFVCSNSVKNLFRWNKVQISITVIPYGTNPEIYKPRDYPLEKGEKNDEFIFLSINSWTLMPNDRKGTDLLIRAFDEEFKETNVKLLLKVSTFWKKITMADVHIAIINLLGHENKNILVNADYIPEEQLIEFYQKSDCFVMPTHGEGFGLTALNAMACALPIIITKDNNSGHMDFCKGKDSVLWIDAPKMEQADPAFFVQGNMQPVPDIDSLKKQMRFAYENQKDLKEKALKNSDEIRTKWTWKITAEKVIEFLKNETRS
jgi:glycosyltransferase involved in cell wall biosynthesis